MHHSIIFTTTPELPSCHAATITALPGGDLLAAWYAGSHEAAPDVAIYGARLPAWAALSGRHWSEPFLLADTPGHAEGNPVLFTDPEGGVWLFYVTLAGDRWTTSHIKLRHSADAGWTWGAERALSPRPGWMFRNRPLVLPSGEWLLPVYDEREWTSFVLLSDDRGKTWRPGSRVTAPPGVIQPAVAPLAGGCLLMLLRTGGPGGCIWQSTSADHGQTWSRPTPTGVPNNNSGLDLIRLHDGRLLLACNPVADSTRRTPLSLLLSDDEGHNWHHWLDVETGPGEFSYPALLQADDGTLHIVYTHHRTAIAHVALSESAHRRVSKSANRWIGGSESANLARASVAESCMQSGLGRVFPAAVLHICQAGSLIFERAYGCLDPETGERPTQPDSLFDLASLTKPFTATAFMRLVEAGHVALTTPVAEVLPEFAGLHPIGPAEDPLSMTTVPPDPQFAGQEVDASLVTFWHLLTHTSGLAAWRSLYRKEAESGKQEAGGKGSGIPLPHRVAPELRAQRIAVIYEQCSFAYPPGERVIYSDLGFILLGEAVARLAGVPLEVYLRQAVLEPLGLRHTTYNPLANGRVPTQIVPTELCAWRGRRCIGEVHDENSASLCGVAGHAGLFSTAAEVAVLGHLYLDGGVYNGARLLHPKTVAQAVHAQVGGAENPRGLGWHQRSVDYSSSGHLFGPRSFGHTGFTGTSLWVDPDRELVVALLTNRVYYGRDPQPIMDFRPQLHDAVVLSLTQSATSARNTQHATRNTEHGCTPSA